MEQSLSTQLLECDTSQEVSEEGTVGVRNKSPQDVSLWYSDYSELKTTETLWAQEKLLSPQPL